MTKDSVELLVNDLDEVNSLHGLIEIIKRLLQLHLNQFDMVEKVMIEIENEKNKEKGIDKPFTS